VDTGKHVFQEHHSRGADEDKQVQGYRTSPGSKPFLFTTTYNLYLTLEHGDYDHFHFPYEKRD
jgi:hypothetical protein